MNKLRCKVYMTAGYNTVSMGTGRKEFHPKKPRPGLDDYIREAGRGRRARRLQSAALPGPGGGLRLCGG